MNGSVTLKFSMLFAVALVGLSRAQDEGKKGEAVQKSAGETGKAVLELSKEKWKWMADKKVDALADLFHEEAVFVHMGGNMSRKRELDIIKSGGIHYKKADIQESSVRVIGATAIVLSKIRLLDRKS